MKAWSAAIVLAMASPAMAQTKEDPLKDSLYGHRVEIMLRSGFGVLGQIVTDTEGSIVKEQDLAKARTILLDMSLEYPELGGRKAIESGGKFIPNIVGFERNQIKSVRRLPDMSPEDVKAREAQREEAYARILAEEASRRKMEAEIESARKKEIEDRLKKKREEEGKTEAGKMQVLAERVQKAAAIYEKYGASAPDTLKAIEGKNLRKQPLSDEDKQLLKDFPEWAWYKANYVDEKPKEPPKEEPKKEEEKKEEKKDEKAPN